MSRQFGVSREIALLPFVFYLLGLSFGPIMAGPSSESFGRKPVYVCRRKYFLSGPLASCITQCGTCFDQTLKYEQVVALPCVAAFTLGAGFSQNITSLIVCRAFAGLFASPGLSSKSLAFYCEAFASRKATVRDMS